MPNRFKWTKQRQRVLYSAKDEVPVDQLAEKLGTTTQSVRQKLAWDKLRKQGWEPKRGYKRKPAAGTVKRVNGYIMEFNGRNWKQKGTY